MVKDPVNGSCHRADKVMENFLSELIPNLPESEQKDMNILLSSVDGMPQQDLTELFERFTIINPDFIDAEDAELHRLKNPFPYNLMFKTLIGPTGKSTGYLRPETAQGIFVNFRRLLQFNGGKLPFGGATIGLAFRNEISPGNGVLRLREFTLAEVEYFINPQDMICHKLFEVEDVVLTLYSRDRQLSGEEPVQMTVRQAVDEKIIENEYIAYFLGRIQRLFVRIGVDPKRLRFRQHQFTQMAHYACDCWDAESLLQAGWTEIAGIADRTAFDLSNHMNGCGADLTAFIAFDEPVLKEKIVAVPNKKLLGPALKKNNKLFVNMLEESSQEELKKLMEDQESGEFMFKNSNNEDVVMTPEFVVFTKETEKITGENVIPRVVEPSFGCSRIIYTVIEHCFSVRPEDAKRTFFKFPPCMAPYDVVVLPLFAKPAFRPYSRYLQQLIHKSGLTVMVDGKGVSIGRRYARTDEIGIPFAVTIDGETLLGRPQTDGDNMQPIYSDDRIEIIPEHTVTIRHRDSGSQIRCPINRLIETLQTLCFTNDWDTVKQSFAAFENAVEF
eukprot:TRINITY_DN11507_c0_g1_i1.p1 TRINITY_DN11507_c0_g1~~TRINITY_DN11507_c0_g1_i1.p1  ORF type:complete len:644 (-),score=202.77 TRINITY_DN11507_c0_g1_i1:313-1983(-)